MSNVYSLLNIFSKINPCFKIHRIYILQTNFLILFFYPKLMLTTVRSLQIPSFINIFLSLDLILFLSQSYFNSISKSRSTILPSGTEFKFHFINQIDFFYLNTALISSYIILEFLSSSKQNFKYYSVEPEVYNVLCSVR